LPYSKKQGWGEKVDLPLFLHIWAY
jgi:hypothetical protein